MIHFSQKKSTDSTNIGIFSTGSTPFIRKINPEEYDFGKAFKQFYQKESTIKIRVELDKYLKIAEAQRLKAVKELNAKTSSSGLTYQEAKQIMYEIETDYYKKHYNPVVITIQQPKFDPKKLQGIDRLLYSKAKEACSEIERANPELAKLNKEIKIHIDSKPYLGTGGLASKEFGRT